MKQISKNTSTITQEQVTEFYDKIIFPSRTSHKAYENLIPKDLRGLKVGDFGCGQSLFIDIFRKLKYDAVFLDISQKALNTIDYGVKIHASLTDIPLEDSYMDVIFCIGVVHHIPEMERAISELARVLKKGGKLYLGIYSINSLQSLIRKWYDKTNSIFLKKIIYLITLNLVWIKNRDNNLMYKSEDNYKRADDLLKTPLVRYLPIEYYIEIFKEFECRVLEIKRISSMNILILEKVQ